MEAHILPASGRSIPRLIRERRWWVALLLLWALAIGLYTHVHVAQMREQMTNVALAGARNMFRMVMLTRNWNASHGGIYVPVTRVEPNPISTPAARRDDHRRGRADRSTRPT
jgi:hypothetical protein